MDDEQEKAWAATPVTRSEMLELVLPLAFSSADLAKSVSTLGLSLVDSDDPDVKVAAIKALHLADDAKKHLRELQTRFKELAGDPEQAPGASHGSSS